VKKSAKDFDPEVWARLPFWIRELLKILES